MHQIYTIICFIVSFCIQHSHASDAKQLGIFTFNFWRFENPSGRLANGQCCKGEPDLEGCPDLPCPTSFLISLRPNMGAAQWKTINYGIVKTDVYTDSRNLSLNFTTEFGINEISWKENFQLLIAAYHTEDSSTQFNLGDVDNLITTTIINSHLIPKEGLKPVVTSHVDGVTSPSMTWNGKVVCVNDYFGDNCLRSCLARNDRFGHFTCDSDGHKICLKGWTGPDLQLPCTKVTCPDGCVEANAFCDTYGVCRCRNGWEGANCDVCVPRAGCLKGGCRSAPGQCACQDGWTGPLCNIDENFCTTNQPCSNGGICVSGAGMNRNHSCICQVGFRGNSCEIPDPCARSPCINEGTCQENGSDYNCQCTAQFQGKDCEKPKCLCENGGSCAVNSSICVCPPSYTGDKCELLVPETTTDNPPPPQQDATIATTTKGRATRSTETTTIICSTDPNNSSNIICGCEGSVKCLESRKGKCFSDPDCAPHGTCHRFENTCKCDPTHTGPFCKTPVRADKTSQKHSSILTPGQMVIVAVVATIIVVAFIVTSLVVHQRKRQDATMLVLSSKEENMALNDPEEGGLNFKSRTTSTAATSRA